MSLSAPTGPCSAAPSNARQQHLITDRAALHLPAPRALRHSAMRDMAGTLEVTLLQGYDLPNVEWIGHKQDPYAVLAVGSLRVRSNTSTDGGKTPVWNQYFTFPIDGTADQTLFIEIYDENVVWKDVLIGTAQLPLDPILRHPSQHKDVTVPVFKGKLKKQKGQVAMRVVFRKGGISPAAVGVVTLEGKVHNPSVASFRTKATSGYTPGMWILPAYKDTSCWQDYEAGQELVKGPFGSTYVGKHIATGDIVTIKVINKNRLATPEDVEDVRHEVQIMHHLEGHPNVVKLLQVYEDKQNVCLVQEYCAGGQLFDALIERGEYTEGHVAQIMRTIISVVAHCHQMGVIHRDLKPEHFVLTDKSPNAVIKTAEFGGSAFFEEGNKLSDIVGSRWYVAPEVLQHSYGKEADIWSCGVILYILLSGTPPFDGENEKEIFHQILNKPLEFHAEPWPGISAAAKDCVCQMLERDVRRRATASEILQHDWMRENGIASNKPLELEVVRRLGGFSNMNRLKQEAIKLIANNLPVDEIVGLRQMFLEIDKDMSGTITVDEFTKAVRQKGQRMSQSEMASLMEAVDMNGDGIIDYEEFLAVMINHGKTLREEHLIQAFKHFDKDGNGSISMEELEKALKESNLSPPEIAAIISEADADCDGEISFEEFCDMMRQL